jgi:hypothetical protein
MFFIDDAQLRASLSFATPSSFFIGAHGQELSVPRNRKKRSAGGQGEFSVGLSARRDVASQPAT